MVHLLSRTSQQSRKTTMIFRQSLSLCIISTICVNGIGNGMFCIMQLWAYQINIKSISMSLYPLLYRISSFSYCKIAWYRPILTFLVSFKRRDSDDSNDGEINDFASIHAKLQSNWKNMSLVMVSRCFSTFQLLLQYIIKGNMKGNTSVTKLN